MPRTDTDTPPETGFDETIEAMAKEITKGREGAGPKGPTRPRPAAQADDPPPPPPTPPAAPAAPNPEEPVPPIPEDIDDEPAAPPPAEPPAEDEPDEPEEPGTPQNHAMAKLRIEARDWKKKYEDLETRLKAGGNGDSAKLQQKLAEAETKLTEAYDRISKVSLEHDPRFIARYDKAQTALLGRVRAALKEFGYEEALVDRLASAGARQRVQLVRNEAGDASEIILGIFGQLEALEAQRETELENHKATAERLDIEAGQAARQRAATKRIQGFDAAVDAMSKGGSVALMRSKTDAKWNEFVDRVVQQGRVIAGRGDDAAIAAAIAAGIQAPVFESLYKAERKRRVELETELRGFRGASPTIGGDEPVPGTIRRRGGDDGMTPDEAIAALRRKRAK
jgi:hypothetical protein